MISKLWFISEPLIRNLRRARKPYHSFSSNKVSLYETIISLGDQDKNIVRELDDWVFEAKEFRIAEVDQIVKDLRKHNRFSHALQVSEWMKKKGVVIFSSHEHAVHIELIGKVRGLDSAEKYFETLKERDKTESIYRALLDCYVQRSLIEKSLSHFQKMKDSGFASTAFTYNIILGLYARSGYHEKVLEVLLDMKNNDIVLDSLSYKNAMNSCGERSDVEGMERFLVEMEGRFDIHMDCDAYCVAANCYAKAGLVDKATNALRKAEERVDTKDGSGYNLMISIHADLGNKSEVLRLWDRLKRECKWCSYKDYILVMKSMSRLGEIEDVEKVFKEWEPSENWYDFRLRNVLVICYCENRECEKAEALLEELSKKDKATTPNTWAVLSAKYLEKKETERALYCMKRALTLRSEKPWKPYREEISKLFHTLNDEGSVEDVEGLIDLLRGFVRPSKQMYCALFKAYERAGEEIDGNVLERMKSDGIEEQDIKNILAKRQSSSREL